MKQLLYVFAALSLVAGSATLTEAGAGRSRARARSAPADLPWNGPAFSASAKDLAAAAARVDAPAGASVIVLIADGSYRFDDDGKKVYEYRRVYKILTSKGADNWGHVEASWSPWYQERPELRARVLTSTGEFRELDPKTVIESDPDSSGNVYDDTRSLRGPLPSLSPGAIVEEQMIWRDTRPMFAAGSTHSYYLQGWVPMLESRFSIDAPAGLPLRVRTKLLDGVKPRRSKRNGRERWEFRLTDLEPLEQVEGFLPSDAPRYPHVAFSIGKSWRDIGRAYHRIVEKQIAAGDAPDARPTLSNPRDRRKVVDETLAFVNKHVRYIGLELGESGIVPYSPSSVWQRRYGDCKDQATLLVALLRRAGVTAHVALLRSGYGQDVDPKLPGLGDFNHAIAVVPDLGPGGTPLWIDPTNELSRAGELPRADQGRLALVIDGKARRLTRIPVMDAAANFTVETRDVYFPIFGGARVVETTRPRGTMEINYRSWYVDADPEKVQEKLEGYVKSEYLAKELGTVDVGPARDVSKPFELKVEALRSVRASTLADSAYVWMFPYDLTGPLPAIFKSEPDDEEPRKGDVAVEPFSRANHYRLHLPDGFEVGDLPGDTTRELGAARLSIDYERVGPRRVDVRQTFTLDRKRLTPAEFLATREAIIELGETDVTPLVLERTAFALANAGKIRESLAEHDRLIASAPTEAAYPAFKSMALLDLGLRDDALAAAKKAVQIEPDLALGHQVLAWTLQFDDIGRRFYPGWDRDGAIAAYRKAVELAPDDRDHLANLAIVLEYDEDGARYSGDVSAAADAYLQRLEKFPDDHEMDVNLVLVLFRAGRLDEMRKHVARLQNDSERAVWTAVVDTVEKGAKSAWRRIRREQSTPASRSAIVSGAAAQLSMSRRYREASDLVQAFGDKLTGGMDPTMIEKLARQSEGGAEEPTIYKKAILALVEHMVRGQKFDTSMRRRYLAGPLANQEAELADLASPGLRATLRPLRDSGLTTDGLVDIMNATIDVKVLEQTDFAVKVRMSSMFGPKRDAEFFFSTDGKLIAAAAQPGSLGAVAFAALKAKRLDEARQWLDWASEYVKKPMGPSFSGAFAELWTRGKKADAETIGRAAAALATESESAVDKKIESVLERCARKDDRSAALCRRARFELLTERSRWNDALELLDGMRSNGDLPSQFDDVVPRVRLDLLLAADRLDDAESYLGKLRTERAAEEWGVYEVRLAENRRDFATARERLNQPDLDSEPTWINQRAWLALYLSASSDELGAARTRMERLIRQGHGQDYSMLNTLAALEARTGDAAQAYETLIKSLNTINRGTLTASDWLVMGQVALASGFQERAREFWTRAVADGGAEAATTPGASANIAAQWLAELPPAPAKERSKRKSRQRRKSRR